MAGRPRLSEAISLGPFAGLRARIVLLIAALTAVMVALFGMVVMRLLEHHLLEQKRQQGRAALLSMQTYFDLAKNPSEFPDIAELVRAMSLNLDLHNLVVVNAEMNTIAHSRPEMVGLVLGDPDLERAVKHRRLVHRIVGRSSSAPEMVFSGPLYVGAKVLGAVRFSLPLDDMTAALAGTRNVLILYAVMDALVVVLFGSLLLWWILVRPIEQLVQGTERMAAGDYRFGPPPTGRTELGRLGRALGKLSTTLRDREATAQRQVERLNKSHQELQRAHDQLTRSDRLAYIGRVAAGIAHEVGNPLGSIYGCLEILQDAELTAEDREVVARLEIEIKRIDRIMRELVGFSRVEPSQPEAVNLLAEAAHTVESMKVQRGLDEIEIDAADPAGLPAVEIDPRQFQQILLNVLLNAADALDRRGRIRIAAETGSYDAAQWLEAALPGAPPESAVPFTDSLRRGIVFSQAAGPAPGRAVVALHVTDEGPGMPSEVLAQLFDPFFTTKPPGKGTGLGMAICQRLVAAAGGVIRVESRPGVGTRVSLIFPRQAEESASDA